VRPEHFLFRDETLVGLVDFGAMGVDTTVADLGRLLAQTLPPRSPARRAFFEAYVAEAPLATEELELVAWFERANAVLHGLTWLQWVVFQERPDIDPQAAIIALRRGLGSLAKRLDDWP
jgi:Ser/Thr protein kinase RdoA (MazF antagonist)